jgi:hypothetical protein
MSSWCCSGGPGRSTGGKLRVRETQTLFGDAAARLLSWKASIDNCSQVRRHLLPITVALPESIRIL